MTTEHVQVGVVHVSESLVGRSVAAAVAMDWSVADRVRLVRELLVIPANSDLDTVVDVANTLGLKGSKLRSQVQSSLVTDTINKHSALCSSVLKLSQGQNMFLSNGKVRKVV